MAENMNKIVIGAGDALVSVDMQIDFARINGALYVAGIPDEVSVEKLATNILNLNNRPFGCVITTEDRHPHGHVEETKFPPHCIKGTLGQKYIDELAHFYANATWNLVKGNHSAVHAYSVGTCDKFAMHIATLREWEIKRIFLTGLAYNYCVGESAIAYAAQGFEVYVVRDATRSVPPPYGNPFAMAQKLALYGVNEITMDDIA